jgi:hypothetical protein
MIYEGIHDCTTTDGYRFVLYNTDMKNEEIIEYEGVKYKMKWYNTDLASFHYHCWFAIPVE